MDAATFERGDLPEHYLHENLYNYYFKKRYQRYDPLPGLIPAVKAVRHRVSIAVGTTKKCPYCVATVPMMIRIFLDAENPALSMRIFDNTKHLMPQDFSGLRMPQFMVYDERFNRLFVLNDSTIKEIFETAFLEELNKIL